MKVVIALLLLVFFCARVAASDITFTEVQEIDLTCTFERSCDVTADPDEEHYCRRKAHVTRIHMTSGGDLIFTPPNGNEIPGQGGRYARFGGVNYLGFVFSNGAGTTHLTVYPDYSAIWTGHFTIRGNMAVSSFGHCEGTL